MGDTTHSGQYQIHLMLYGMPIKGSPVLFDATAAHPGPQHSWLQAPPIDPCIASYEDPTVVILHTRDRFNNVCTQGGLMVTGRLQLLKAVKKDAGVQHDHALQ